MKKNEIHQIRAILREMVRELGMLSRKSSGTRLSPLQSHILIELNSKPLGTTELASKLCVDKASMSRALRTLISAGYLTRENDEYDGRASTFCLSHSGKQLLLSLEENADKFIEEALSSSSHDEIQEFARTMTSFTQCLHNAHCQREAKVIFRLIREEDNPKIADIIRKSFQENKIDHLEGVSLHDPAIAHLSQVYNHAHAKYWVIEFKGEIVGGAGLAPLVGEEGICEMQKLYLSRHVKGMGIGRRMIAFIIQQAIKMGYHACYLETLNELKEAVRLYEAFGFHYIPEPLGNTGHNSCDIYMIKELQADGI